MEELETESDLEELENNNRLLEKVNKDAHITQQNLKETRSTGNDDEFLHSKDFKSETEIENVEHKPNRRTTEVISLSKDKRKHHHHNHHRHTKVGHPETTSTSEKVKVIVRCRPMSEKETLQGHIRVVHISPDKGEIEVHRPNPASSNMVNAKVDKTFTFDSVYDERISQGKLYEEAFSDLVNSVLNGFNSTIFAYGQTGTGKTYTMEGMRESREEEGVIPNAFRHIFDRINASPDQTYLVRASYLEIYQEEIKDLLSSKLKICELKENSDGIYVKGLSDFLCRDFYEINKLMTRGNKNRSTGATNMNEHSSRSHAIFIITVEMSEKWADGESHVKVGRLNLVDLAGSERQGKTGAEGERLKEAVKINLSLSALGNVIGALADGKNGHIPYRDSKLTRLLTDSLGGNSRTIMVATIGPASFNYDETMVTLRYASRAKRIKNKPKINEDPKDAMLRNYQEEIAKLRAMLDSKLSQRSDEGSYDEEGESGRGRMRKKNYVEENGLFDAALLLELAPYLENAQVHHHIQNNPKEVLRILEEKRNLLLADTETVKEEKERLIKKLESTHKKVQQAEDECNKLHDRIEWLESKMLNGEKTLLDHTNEQLTLIKERQKELDAEKAKEDEMRKKLAEHDLTVVELLELQTTVETQVTFDDKRLKKILSKVIKAEKVVEEQTQQHNFEFGRLQRYLQHLQKEAQLNKGILDNFLPNQIRHTLENLAQHNSDNSFSFMPITSMTQCRPLVNRMTSLPLYNKPVDDVLHPVDDLFYVDENILQLQPIPPVHVTRAYVRPDTDQHIKSVMQRAVAEAEKDILIDCNRIMTLQRRRATTARVRLGEVLTLENNLNVRQVLSAKHRSKEIPYKDFVVVGRVSSERGQSGLPFQNQLRKFNHVSLSPDFPFFPPLPASPETFEGKVCPGGPYESYAACFCDPREEYLHLPLIHGEKRSHCKESLRRKKLNHQQQQRLVSVKVNDGEDEMSLEELQGVLEKQKNLTSQTQTNIDAQKRRNYFYADALSHPPPPPCTAISPNFDKVNRLSYQKSMRRKSDIVSRSSDRGDMCQTESASARAQKLFTDDLRSMIHDAYRQPSTSEETMPIPYRSAHHIGITPEALRRDPDICRSNCYPGTPITPRPLHSRSSLPPETNSTFLRSRDKFLEPDSDLRHQNYSPSALCSFPCHRPPSPNPKLSPTRSYGYS